MIALSCGGGLVSVLCHDMIAMIPIFEDFAFQSEVVCYFVLEHVPVPSSEPFLFRKQVKTWLHSGATPGHAGHRPTSATRRGPYQSLMQTA